MFKKPIFKGNLSNILQGFFFVNIIDIIEHSIFYYWGLKLNMYKVGVHFVIYLEGRDQIATPYGMAVSVWVGRK